MTSRFCHSPSIFYDTIYIYIYVHISVLPCCCRISVNSCILVKVQTANQASWLLLGGEIKFCSFPVLLFHCLRILMHLAKIEAKLTSGTRNYVSNYLYMYKWWTWSAKLLLKKRNEMIQLAKLIFVLILFYKFQKFLLLARARFLF